MALAVTHRSDVFSTSAATSYATTQSFTPTAGALMLCWVSSTGTTNQSPTAVSGNGVTYALFGTVYDPSTTQRLELWIGLAGASPSAGVVTASGWGTSRSGCAVIVDEVTGADTTVSAAAAIVQAVKSTPATATSATVTLAAAGDAANRPYACAQHAANELTTPRANWTELADGSYNTPATGTETQWRSDAFETTASASWTTSSVSGIYAIELKNLLVVTGPAVAPWRRRDQHARQIERAW